MSIAIIQNCRVLWQRIIRGPKPEQGVEKASCGGRPGGGLKDEHKFPRGRGWVGVEGEKGARVGLEQCG